MESTIVILVDLEFGRQWRKLVDYRRRITRSLDITVGRA